MAPLKEQTVPRLELLGATILARLIHVILKCLISSIEIYCWTDSYTALYWIKNDKPWRPYVQHRVNEMRNLTLKNTWRFCPGTMNPADIASRSCTGQELIEQELWWSRPTFLKSSSDSWPNLPTQYKSKAADEKVVKKPTIITHSLVSLSEHDGVPNLSNLIDIKRHSSKLKLLKVTGWVLKFVTLLQAKDKNRIIYRLKAEDLKKAEAVWIKHIQRQCFEEEYNALILGKESTVVYKHQLLFINDD